MDALKIGWDFFQNEVLGMAWLNKLISTILYASTRFCVQPEVLSTVPNIPLPASHLFLKWNSASIFPLCDQQQFQRHKEIVYTNLIYA